MLPRTRRGAVRRECISSDRAAAGVAPGDLNSEREGVARRRDVHPPRKAVGRSRAQAADRLRDGVAAIIGGEVAPGEAATMDYSRAARELGVACPTIRPAIAIRINLEASINDQAGRGCGGECWRVRRRVGGRV